MITLRQPQIHFQFIFTQYPWIKGLLTACSESVENAGGKNENRLHKINRFAATHSILKVWKMQYVCLFSMSRTAGSCQSLSSTPYFTLYDSLKLLL